jgi:hypothetical protein
MGSTEVYNSLLSNPVTILGSYQINIPSLPACADATVMDLFFSSCEDADGNVIGIAVGADTAVQAAIGAASPAIQKKMAVSSMRGSELSPDSNPGGRYQSTVVLDATAANAGLWVTQLQNGCSLLILDWGAGKYSMVHLQPSEDKQFNKVGQGLMSTGDTAKNAYKNLWMKQELTKIVNATNTAGPQKYIMVQSMFEGARGAGTQVIGVINNAKFDFYKQRQMMARGTMNLTVTTLQWYTWSVLLPYVSY